VKIALALILIGLTGCAFRSPAPRASRSSAPAIDHVHLICRPAAANFDSEPGPDGIGVTLYASSPAEPKTVRIAEGTLQVLLFDGVVADDAISGLEPFRVWTFTAEDLQQLRFMGSLGVCYPLSLRWGDAKPAQARMTVIARYTPPFGAVLQSAAGVISMTQ
jgi:hypothetical protein